jgi:hypothetical protein
MGGVAFTAALGLTIGQVSSTLAGPFISSANALNSLMVHSVDPFARVGVASIRLPEYTGWAAAIYVVYYVPLAVLAVSLSRWRPLVLPGAGNELNQLDHSKIFMRGVSRFRILRFFAHANFGVR